MRNARIKTESEYEKKFFKNKTDKHTKSKKCPKVRNDDSFYCHLSMRAMSSKLATGVNRNLSQECPPNFSQERERERERDRGS